MSDDWGDIDYDTRMGRRRAAAVNGNRGGGGLGREERFIITLAVTAAVMLVIGVGVGFALGRASAPKAAPAQAADTTTTAEPTTTPVAETTVSAEVTVPVEPAATSTPVVESTPTPQPLKAPTQIAPDYGAKINADRVSLKWGKITGAVTYAFEIQTRVNGSWTNDQVISGLKSTSYSARVLTSLRHWRVWAVDSSGKAGAKSDWSTYSHTAVKSTSSSKPSTETTH